MTKIKLLAKQASAYSALPKLISVPLARGQFIDAKKLRWLDEEGTELKVVSAKTLSVWDDGSIKWVNLQLDLSAYRQDEIDVEVSQQAETQVSEQIHDFSELLAKLSPNVVAQGKPLQCQKVNNTVANEVQFELHDEQGQPVRVKIRVAAKSLGVEGLCQIDCSIHNYNRARHPGGLWDLGDSGSFEFDSFDLDFKLDGDGKGQLTLSNTQQQGEEEFIRELTSLQGFRVHQFSSGSPQWNSENHVDKTGKVNLEKRGFEVHYQDAGQPVTTQGERIQPLLKLENSAQHLALSIRKFWQNFPSALAVEQDKVVLGFFPKQAYVHELQGGERKTFQCVIDTQGNSELVAAALQNNRASVCPQFLCESNAITLFESDTQSEPLYGVIEQGLASDNNFFEKREKVDEYGWRHFGDLFADHEAFGESGKKVKFSHYNNQYDPIWGFLRQYLRTGEAKWFELADDLVQHVLDIDIYRTDLDRDEYNNGLFWHTDHYSDASTCTHRTFSKNHSAVYEGYQSGGGPGGQHCYTHGLALYYFLTGNEDAKNTVLSMTEWIAHIYEGSPSILGTLFAIKRSKAIGVKNVVTGRYPLDRGTGNYINALLDSYQLTGSERYFDRAFDVLKNTLHPNDDIDSFGFDNIELTWFYSILLQSVVRVLEIKRQQAALDEQFWYCRDILSTYAQWMYDNEEPYLDQVEKLEFPNLTWAAQDLRRANLFYSAAYYCDSKYCDKADSFHQHVVDKLKDSPESSLTRIQALIMQNIGVKGFYESQAEFKATTNTVWPDRKKLSAPIQISKLMTTALFKLSIKKELDWLRVRSSKAEQYLGEKKHG